MKKCFIAIIVVLLGLVAFKWYQLAKTEKKLEVAVANMKAYDSQLSYEKKKNVVLQLTTDQLNYFRDSTLQVLNDTRKELKIKDKNLKALQAIKSSFIKKDTIIVTQVDTLFKEPTLAVDTVIGDDWYNVRLGLKYPSMIAIEPYFKSEKYVVISNKRETVNPPKKFFLFKWFQKKHTIVCVEVVEKNPYVENETSKYIEIIR